MPDIPRKTSIEPSSEIVLGEDSAPSIREKSSWKKVCLYVIAVIFAVWLFLILAVLAAECTSYATFIYRRSFGPANSQWETQPSSTVGDDDDEPRVAWPIDPDDPYADLPPYGPTKRSELSSYLQRGRSRVSCWPSTGGVWIKEVTPVELDFLGLDRFAEAEKSSDPAEEDSFCRQLRKIDAGWYELPPRWPAHTLWCSTVDACTDPKERLALELAWTGDGGVWVLDMEDGDKNPDLTEAGFWNAFTMEERGRVIEKLGGKFCADPLACPETAKLVGELTPPQELAPEM